MVNSGFLDGISTKKEAIAKMLEFLKEKGIGEKGVQYKMKDWAFNRQRYWGEPIPIVYCEKCGMVPVPYSELPLKPVSKVADSISGQYLLEPNALILKSGCQDVCCELWAARKCAPSCHVYLCDEKPEGEMARYYKTFEVIEIKDYSKSSLKEVAAAYPVCEVSAKAMPVRSEELARSLKVKSGIAKDGSHYHIFALGTAKGKKFIVGRHL